MAALVSGASRFLGSRLAADDQGFSTAIDIVSQVLLTSIGASGWISACADFNQKNSNLLRRPQPSEATMFTQNRSQEIFCAKFSNKDYERKTCYTTSTTHALVFLERDA